MSTVSTGDVDVANTLLRRWLTGCAVLVVAALVVGAIARRVLPDWFAPGGPLMQSIAIVGGVLFVMAFVSVFAKRAGKAPRGGLRRHIVLSLFATVFVAFHSTGSVLKPAMLLLLTLAALGGLGAWARTQGAQAMAGVFGQKRRGFASIDTAARDQLRDLSRYKSALLPKLDAQAEERTFSLQLAHWIQAPLTAWRYSQAVKREHELIGTRQSVHWRLAYWRRFHQLLAWAFVLGLALHVVLVLFFAGYVADGREVYWWHFTAWDIEWL